MNAHRDIVPLQLPEALGPYLQKHRPDDPFYVFSGSVLEQTARRFMNGFDGLVTYAVKANSDRRVLSGLVAAGVRAFDVASVREMEQVHAVLPDAVLHYNNPIRSPAEVEMAKRLGVASYSVDSFASFERLGDLACGTEVSVRLHLDIDGGAYDFGSKFGADEDEAIALLRAIAGRGLIAAMTFHPGTQCTNAQAWVQYIEACKRVSDRAGVVLARLNVGGGFPAHRGVSDIALEDVFRAIRAGVDEAFGPSAPRLVCEPGRAMVSDAFAVVLRVKQRRARDGAVFLNDGIYGAMGEVRDLALPDRLHWVSQKGPLMGGQSIGVTVFGPTCDSLDAVPELIRVPMDVEEGDYLLIEGMGAYSMALTTDFNGYGARRIVDEFELMSGQSVAAS